MGEFVPKGNAVIQYLNSLHAEEVLEKLQDLQVGNKLVKVRRVDLAREKVVTTNCTAPTEELQTSFLLTFPKQRASGAEHAVHPRLE